MFSSKQGYGNANESSTRAAKYLSIGIGNVVLPTLTTPPVTHFNQTALTFNGANTAICITQSANVNCAASWSATSSNSQDGGTNGNLWVGNTGQLTIEYWVYFNNLTGQIGFFESGANGVALGLRNTGTIAFFSQSQVSFGTQWTIPTLSTGTWYHMVWQRSYNVAGGPYMNFWVNGTSYTATTTNVNTTNFTGANPQNGKTTPYVGGGQGSVFLNGYMQEFRISNIARYAPGINFTPPNASFVNDPNTLLLIHGKGSITDDNS